MANVLGTLFGEIANAIRSKTGETGKMKPAEFAEKIEAIESGGSDYNLALAEMLMTRSAENYSSDPTTLSMRGFKLSDGGTLGNLRPYSFAGFQDVESMIFTDSLLIEPFAFADNYKLKILDLTISSVFKGVAFYQHALKGCSALESVIIRDGGIGIERVNFASTTAGWDDIITETGTGANETFCVYVPAAYYDTIVANVDADKNAAVPSSRYRKLEDYPLVDKWNETHTVRFYDGETLLETKTVKYGTSVNYSATKNGCKFVNWNPAPVNVTEDMDCYGVWVPATMNDATWEEIQYVADAGKLSSVYSLGAEKDVTIAYGDGTTENITMVLEAYSGALLADGTTAKASFLSKSTLATQRPMHSIDTNVKQVPYNNTSLFTWLANELYPSLPEDLQGIIKEKDCCPDQYATYAAKCWVPSRKELGLTDSEDTKSVALSRYTSNSARIKTLGANGSAVIYWGRTWVSSGTYEGRYRIILTTGGESFTIRTAKDVGVCFGFCI